MGRHFITVQEAKANYGERWSVVARQFLDADAVRHPHHCLTECDDDGTGLTHPTAIATPVSTTRRSTRANLSLGWPTHRPPTG